MIKNLPKELEISNVYEFNFGDTDAKDDDLLPKCPIVFRPIQEFLEGGKHIVIGDRGTGKSALFRMIRDKQLQFRMSGRGAKRQIIVAIDDDLQYSKLKHQVLKAIPDTTLDDFTKYRIAWELFVVLRVVQELTNAIKSSVLEGIKNDISIALGISEPSAGIMHLLANQKKTVGVKLENTHAGLVIPNFYTSIEPALGESAKDRDSIISLDVDKFKSEINKFLKDNKSIAYVLIDKIDEFVVKDDYDTQRAVLQALLLCQRGYSGFDNIKIKLFIRGDLFSKLDFQVLGYDKVISKTVELIWTAEDIREFIAKRIMFNYFSIFKLHRLEILLSRDSRHVDKRYLTDQKKTAEANSSQNWIKLLSSSLMRLVSGQKADIRDARNINLWDKIHRCIITSIFPRELNDRLSSKKNRPQINIFSCLERSFSTGRGVTNPRVILMLLQRSLDATKDYYNKNPDHLVVPKDVNGEYPLFLRDCIASAEMELQKHIWETLANIDKKWLNLIHQVRELFRNQKNQKIMYTQLSSKLLNCCSGEEELKQFLAFCVHIGLLSCSNSLKNSKNREYELAMLLR